MRESVQGTDQRSNGGGSEEVIKISRREKRSIKGIGPVSTNSSRRTRTLGSRLVRRQDAGTCAWDGGTLERWMRWTGRVGGFPLCDWDGMEQGRRVPDRLNTSSMSKLNPGRRMHKHRNGTCRKKGEKENAEGEGENVGTHQSPPPISTHTSGFPGFCFFMSRRCAAQRRRSVCRPRRRRWRVASYTVRCERQLIHAKSGRTICLALVELHRARQRSGERNRGRRKEEEEEEVKGKKRTLSNRVCWSPSLFPIGRKKHIHAKTAYGRRARHATASTRERAAAIGARNVEGVVGVCVDLGVR